MNLHFRDYTPGDSAACVSIFRSNVPTYFRDHELSGFLDFLDSPPCPYSVILTDGQVIACGGFGLHPGSDTADLCWGMVHADHHRRRVGTFLLFARLHAIVTTTVARSVRLGTSQLTDPFFERYGFTAQSRKTDGIAPGLDAVEMRLELTEERRAAVERQWRQLIGMRHNT